MGRSQYQLEPGGDGRLSWAVGAPLFLACAFIVAIATAIICDARLQQGALHLLGRLTAGWQPFKIDDVEAFAANRAPRLLILIVSPIPILLIEIWAVGYHGASLHRLTATRSASAHHDFLTFILVLTGIWTLLALLLTLGLPHFLGALLIKLNTAISGHRLKIRTGYFLGDLSLYFLALTFFDYWSHRISHLRPFWYLHRSHHAATEMTMLTLWRGHPVSGVIETVLRTWPLAFFDMTPAYILLISYFVVSYEYLIHSNLVWNWGWFGRWILIPPVGHRVHHSRNPLHFNTNLGTIVLWDRLFGTWYGGGTGREAIGTDEGSYNSGRFAAEIWRDLLAFLHGLLPGFQSGKSRHSSWASRSARSDSTT